MAQTYDDWNEEAQKLEVLEKSDRCTHHLYAITPQMTGVFSIAEMVESAFMMPKGRVYVCFLEKYSNQKFDKGQWRSLMAVKDLLEKYNVATTTSLADLVKSVKGN